MTDSVKAKVSISFYSLPLYKREAREASNIKPREPHYPDNPYDIEDACSFLEQLRAYQLGDILGKYKLF